MARWYRSRPPNDAKALSGSRARGENDTYITSAETDALAALVAAKRVKTYANAGHFPPWEQPAALAQDVLAFRR